MKLRAILATCLLSLAPVLPATAAIITYDAILGPEVTGATGTGFVVLEFDTTTNELAIDAIWSGLSGITTAAHIHCCTAAPNTGTAGVATTVPTFSGFPGGVSAGAYSTVLDLDLASSFNPNFVTAHGGTLASATADLLAGLDADKAYFNIHADTFPGGEIRGFLDRCGGTPDNPCESIAAVPEPATLALLGLGLAGLGFSRRKQ